MARAAVRPRPRKRSRPHSDKSEMPESRWSSPALRPSIRRNLAGRRRRESVHVPPDAVSGFAFRFRAALRLRPSLIRCGSTSPTPKKSASTTTPRSTNCCMPRRPAFTACAPTSITRTSMASWPIRASWARCWRRRPTARTSPSSSSARPCRRRRRRRASPRNTPCSTASAAAGWSPAFRPACRRTR